MEGTVVEFRELASETDKQFSITTRRLPSGVVKISPRGDIDLDNAHALRDAIDAAFGGEQQPRIIRVDLWSVTFIDSIGISALGGGYHTAAVRGARLVVTDPSDFVYRQLYISGLVGLFGAPQPRQAGHDEPEPVS
jgi:anti-sigma B factor antagonist